MTVGCVLLGLIIGHVRKAKGHSASGREEVVQYAHSKIEKGFSALAVVGHVSGAKTATLVAAGTLRIWEGCCAVGL